MWNALVTIRQTTCFLFQAGIRIVVSVGTLVILALVAALYLKFRKALFVLLIPTAVTVLTVVAIITRRHRFVWPIIATSVMLTVVAIITRRHRFVWPIIATSMFHIVLACYALLIFSFYFFFKPFYIIMVLNWVFDSGFSFFNSFLNHLNFLQYSFLLNLLLTGK
ncbi:unnamed protein product [Strongylus vulgaris]|uniref:Uncharacterized protein n=1 Tax=Strongylus vulgaris TaxID=40348 RepID=A0A3P7J0Y2_STRVU|nr:unnamed protein product [Strongylus vulgaris]